MRHSWPGNVRELENTLLRAAVLARGRTLMPRRLRARRPGARTAATEPLSLEDAVRQRCGSLLDDRESSRRTSTTRVLARVERPLIELVLERTGGNQVKAADMLGINRNTLRKKITDARHRRSAQAPGGAVREPRSALPPLYAIVDPLDTGRDPLALAGAHPRRRRPPAAAPPEERRRPRAARRWPRAVRAVAPRAGALLIVNDRPDVAAAVGRRRRPPRPGRPAGRGRARDARPGRARSASRPTTSSEARAAVAAGADYLGVGPIFATTSKAAPCPRAASTSLARRARALARSRSSRSAASPPRRPPPCAPPAPTRSR